MHFNALCNRPAVRHTGGLPEEGKRMKTAKPAANAVRGGTTRASGGEGRWEIYFGSVAGRGSRGGRNTPPSAAVRSATALAAAAWSADVCRSLPDAQGTKAKPHNSPMHSLVFRPERLRTAKNPRCAPNNCMCPGCVQHLSPSPWENGGLNV